MEMKEIYPKLPTAPPIEDQGQGHRLQKINEIQALLEKEVATREALGKKYFRVAGIVDNVDTVNHRWWCWRCCLVVNSDRSTRCHSDRRSGAFYGIFFSIIGKYGVKKSTSKAEKHEKIKTIASAKLHTIVSHVSKALSDNTVTDEEFRLILEELEKYKVMKEEVRSKTKLGQRLRKR